MNYIAVNKLDNTTLYNNKNYILTIDELLDLVYENGIILSNYIVYGVHEPTEFHFTVDLEET